MSATIATTDRSRLSPIHRFKRQQGSSKSADPGGEVMGFDTAEDSIAEIAAKIASALIDPTVIDPAA